MAEPLLKYPGGKRKLAARILEELAPIERLFEPFCGSAAVSLAWTGYTKRICDINPDVIGLLRAVQREPDEFIDCARETWDRYPNDAAGYAAARNAFNDASGVFNWPRRAALLLYLNRHCFNGLVRYNLKGDFNVPFGRYKTVSFSEQAIWAAHRSLAMGDVEVMALDFRSIMLELSPGDACYADPPYFGTSDTANFTGYSKRDWTDADHYELAALAYSCRAHGARTGISASDTSRSRECYYRASRIVELSTPGTISARTAGRCARKELLFIYE